MNSYEAKQEERRERLEAAAEKARARSNAAYASSNAAVAGIPMGQPILVGHHSEGKHRNAIKRSHAAMDRSIAEARRADELTHKAASVGTGGISSDDPDAIARLRSELANCEISQALMRDANKLLRKTVREAGPGDPNDPAWIEVVRLALVEPCKTLYPAHWEKLVGTLIECPWGTKLRGFEGYALSNNSANMRRIKARIKALEGASTRETKSFEVIDGVKVIQNVEENRVQFIFDAKPDEATRKILKSHAFRWAPSQDAWQRQLTNAGIYSARLVMAELKKASLK